MGSRAATGRALPPGRHGSERISRCVYRKQSLSPGLSLRGGAAMAGGRLEGAGGLLERQYERMWRQGEWSTLERWLRALPSALIRTRPHLSIALAGVCNYYCRTAEAEQVLNDCRFEPQEAGEPR